MTLVTRAHLLSVFIGALVGLAIAAILGPTHTAQSRIIAGQVSAQAAAVPSYATAAQYLAETYSRVIESDRARREIRIELGKRDDARTSITASPIPESAIIVVEARSSSEELAVRGANAGADALTAEVNRLLEEQDRSDELRKRYRARSLDLSRARTELRRVESSDPDGADPKTARSVERLQARIATDKVTLDSYAAQLNQTVTSAAAGNSVSPLEAATQSTSNLPQRLILFAFLGGLIGLAAAVAAGSFRARRRNTTDTQPA